MDNRADRIIDLKAKWVAQATPDHLSAVIYCGLESVCVVGKTDPDTTNAIIDHIVALRGLAREAASYRAAVATNEKLAYSEHPRDDEAVSKSSMELAMSSVALDHALCIAGDPCAIRRQAAREREDEIAVPGPGHHNPEDWEEVELPC